MIKTNKREDIIAAAIRLMAEGGAEALTASALAAHAGVSKANIFHHFTGLDAVVVAAFEQFLAGMDSLQPQSSGSVRDWLLALGEETQDQIGAAPELSSAYFAFAAAARTRPGLKAQLAGVMAAARAQFIGSLEQLAPGRWSLEQRERIASLLLVAADGLALHRYLFPEQRQDQLAAWRQLVESILHEEA